MSEDQTWPVRFITESEIKHMAEIKQLGMKGRNIDWIVRSIEKGVSAGIEDVWDQIIEEAISNNEPDWEFKIESTECTECQDVTIGKNRTVNENWNGTIKITGGYVRTPEDVIGVEMYSLKFTLNNSYSSDNGCIGAEITTVKPDDFLEEEWDTLVYQATNFIETDFKKQGWMKGKSILNKIQL